MNYKKKKICKATKLSAGLWGRRTM